MQINSIFIDVLSDIYNKILQWEGIKLKFKDLISVRNWSII